MCGLDPDCPHKVQADTKGKSTPVKEEVGPCVQRAVPNAACDTYQEGQSRKRQHRWKADPQPAGAEQGGDVGDSKEDDPEIDESEAAGGLGVQQ